MSLVFRRSVFLALAAMLTVAAPAASQAPSTTEQEIVEKARYAVDHLRQDPDFAQMNPLLARAKGVLVVPSLLKAGFILGGEGGSGVLLARGADGTWTYPAFYTMGSGSIGLQIGVQDAEVILVIMTDNGLKQVVNSQFKLGAEASIAVGPVGAGVQAATTLALGADIYSFAKTRGAFGGGSFEGSVIYKRDDWNRAYYGKPVTPEDILFKREQVNPHADALRAALARP